MSGVADPQDERAALIERIAEEIRRHRCNETAGAVHVLSLLDNGGYLCEPGEIPELLAEIERDTNQYGELARENDALKAEVERLRHAAATTAHDVEQTLGRALRYPPYGPDMFPDGVPNGDVCVGDHVPESLADEAADLIERLRADQDRWMARAYAAENVRWDGSVPPGGEVCATCGIPVEDEPCSAHSPVLPPG